MAAMQKYDKKAAQRADRDPPTRRGWQRLNVDAVGENGGPHHHGGEVRMAPHRCKISALVWGPQRVVAVSQPCLRGGQ